MGRRVSGIGGSFSRLEMEKVADSFMWCIGTFRSGSHSQEVLEDCWDNGAT